jgi:hypothetical protein
LCLFNPLPYENTGNDSGAWLMLCEHQSCSVSTNHALGAESMHAPRMGNALRAPIDHTRTDLDACPETEPCGPCVRLYIAVCLVHVSHLLQPLDMADHDGGDESILATPESPSKRRKLAATSTRKPWATCTKVSFRTWCREDYMIEFDMSEREWAVLDLQVTAQK